MDYRNIIDVEKTSQILLVANTPTYLYESFVRNNSIFELHNSFSDQELINFYYREINNERSLENLTYLYSLIIAIGFYDTAHSVGFFNELKKEKTIKWAEQISNLYFSKVSFEFYERETELEFSSIEFSDTEYNETKTINML